ncbi:MAG: hypothetical protein MUO70_01545, partial [Euryarchaeota archaeon]|nr:hypothetical protein [Euryarchaeota archaeon]
MDKLNLPFSTTSQEKDPKQVHRRVTGSSDSDPYLPSERENMKRWHVAGDDPRHSANLVSLRTMTCP